MEAYREIYRQALTAEDGLSVALKAVKELTTLAMITEGRNVHDKDPEADEE
jgi:hypothetical protein